MPTDSGQQRTHADEHEIPRNDREPDADGFGDVFDHESVRRAEDGAAEHADRTENRSPAPRPRPAEDRVLLIELDERGFARRHIRRQRAIQWMQRLPHAGESYASADLVV